MFKYVFLSHGFTKFLITNFPKKFPRLQSLNICVEIKNHPLLNSSPFLSKIGKQRKLPSPPSKQLDPPLPLGRTACAFVGLGKSFLLLKNHIYLIFVLSEIFLFVMPFSQNAKSSEILQMLLIQNKSIFERRETAKEVNRNI